MIKLSLQLSIIFVFEILFKVKALSFFRNNRTSSRTAHHWKKVNTRLRDNNNETEKSFRRVLALKGGYDSTVGPDPSNPIQFFTFSGGKCPYAARTRMVLHELGLPFEIVEVQISESGEKPDWYLRINPKGKVPALRVPADDNMVIYESAICDEYLCDIHAKLNNGDSSYSSLMPMEPLERARIRLMNDQVDNVLLPAFYTYFMNFDDAKEKEMLQKFEESLNYFENSLVTHGGPYLNGKNFSLADVHILPFFLRMAVSLRHFKDYELSNEKFPCLIKWYDLCCEKESVQKSFLPEQVIIELYEKFRKIDYKFGGLNKN